MEVSELARDIALSLIGKSGAREWDDTDIRTRIADASLDIATRILGGLDPVAVTAVFRQKPGTPKTFKPSGGDVVMTPTSLSNGSYWQSPKVDLGDTFATVYDVSLNVELAATPTAGNTISLWWNASSSLIAGTDNQGGCAGTDAAYTGYLSNAAASVKQLQFVGDFIVTTQATATIQKGKVQGVLAPTKQYGSFVILNGSGAALHSNAANFAITITPQEGTSEPS